LNQIWNSIIVHVNRIGAVRKALGIALGLKSGGRLAKASWKKRSQEKAGYKLLAETKHIVLLGV
jgi:hypothetical protein